jgi:hypothetical protein
MFSLLSISTPVAARRAVSREMEERARPGEASGPAPSPCCAVWLLADAQLSDQDAVAAEVLALEVLEQATALSDELQEASPGMMVLGMGLEVLRKIADPLAEEGDLDLG